MEGELPRCDSLATVFDRFLNGDEGASMRSPWRVASLERQLLVELAQPYRRGTNRFAIAEAK